MYKSPTVRVELEYWFNSPWSVLWVTDFEVYGNLAKDSPLVAIEESGQTYEMTLGVRYLF